MIAIGLALIKCIPDLVTAVPTIFSRAYLTHLKKIDWGEIGGNLMEGIRRGYSQGFNSTVGNSKRNSWKSC